MLPQSGAQLGRIHHVHGHRCHISISMIRYATCKGTHLQRHATRERKPKEGSCLGRTTLLLRILQAGEAGSIATTASRKTGLSFGETHGLSTLYMYVVCGRDNAQSMTSTRTASCRAEAIRRGGRTEKICLTLVKNSIMPFAPEELLSVGIVDLAFRESLRLLFCGLFDGEKNRSPRVAGACGDWRWPPERLSVWHVCTGRSRKVSVCFRCACCRPCCTCTSTRWPSVSCNASFFAAGEPEGSHQGRSV